MARAIERAGNPLKGDLIQALDIVTAASDGSEDAIVRLAASPSADASARVAACRLLAFVRVKGSTPALVMALGDRDPRVRLAAAGALGASPRPPVAPLVRTLRGDELEEVRGAAAHSLAAAKGVRAIQALDAALRCDAAESVRAAAAHALGGASDPSVAASLTRTVRNDPAAAVRKQAAWSLGQLGSRHGASTHADVVPVLVDTLADRTAWPEVRGMAAEQLGLLGARWALPTVTEALHDEAAEVRFWAAYALAWIGDAESLPELEQLAQSDRAVLPLWGPVAGEARSAIGTIRARLDEPRDG